MIDERASIKSVLIDMLHQPDGVTVYVCTAASVLLLGFNVFFPTWCGRTTVVKGNGL